MIGELEIARNALYKLQADHELLLQENKGLKHQLRDVKLECGQSLQDATARFRSQLSSMQVTHAQNLEATKVATRAQTMQDLAKWAKRALSLMMHMRARLDEMRKANVVRARFKQEERWLEAGVTNKMARKICLLEQELEREREARSPGDRRPLHRKSATR